MSVGKKGMIENDTTEGVGRGRFFFSKQGIWGISKLHGDRDGRMGH